MNDSVSHSAKKTLQEFVLYTIAVTRKTSDTNKAQASANGRVRRVFSSTHTESQWQSHILSHNCRAELCGELSKYRAQQHCTLSHGCGYELAT